MKDQFMAEAVLFSLMRSSVTLSGSKAEAQLLELILLILKNMNLQLSMPSYTAQSTSVQEQFYRVCSDNLKELKKHESQRFKYLKFMNTLSSNDRFTELLLSTQSLTLDYRTMIEEFLIVFTNPNENLCK